MTIVDEKYTLDETSTILVIFSLSKTVGAPFVSPPLLQNY